MKRPTIMDVALASGVSKTTVSKVMNVPAELLDVPASTRDRVLKASRELGYQPSWRARAFARGKTHAIGLVHVEAVPMFVGELWQGMVAALIDSLHDAGYDAQFVPASGGDRWKQLLMDQRLDGCVIFHELLPEVAETLQRAKLPAVLLNASDPRYTSVVPDDRQGARDLTEYLLKLGHQRIAFIDLAKTARHFSFRERRGGFLDTMTAAGLKESAVLISESRDEAMRQLLAVQTDITAVITYSDNVALPVMHELWRRGIRVPDDLTVVTFNDVPITRLSNPPLTTVSIPAAEIGRRAAELIVKQIESPEEADPKSRADRRVVLPETLIVRESSVGPRAQR